MNDRFDLPERPEPESDADLYEGDHLPDTSSIEEFVGQDNPVWSQDISDAEDRGSNSH